MKQATALYLSCVLALPLLSAAARAQGPDGMIRRDTVIPATFDEHLSIVRNHIGDPFTVTVSDNFQPLPRGAKIEGHVADIHQPYENHPGWMDMHFDALVMPDGSRAPIDAVPVALNSHAIRRDRYGRLVADEKKVRSENIVIGGAIGGLLVGALIGKPFEGTFVGAIAGILGAEANRNDTTNNSDVIARPGSKVGVLLQSDLQSPYGVNYQPQDTRGRDWRDGNNPPPPPQQGYNGDADFYRRPYYQGPGDNHSYRGDNRRYDLNARDEVSYDGRSINFPVEQQPYMKGDVLMVPLQYMATVMGLTMDTRPDGRIYVENDDNILRLEQDSKAYRLNGKRGELPAIVENHSGIIYVPVDILAAISARPVYVNGTKLEPIPY